MKSLVSLCVLFCSVISFGQEIKQITIPSDAFGQPRQIWVYTPEGYTEETAKRFEVIYVFDAQARAYFDMVHSALNFLSLNNPMIVVGIVSNDRNKDFFPKNDHEETAKKYYNHLGDADKMLGFMSHDVVPYIDDHYRTLPTRIAVGHSNGGTFISYCLLEKPELFDAYIAISPNYAYDGEQFVKRFEKFDPSKLSEKYFYMCNSNEGTDWIPARQKVAALFNSPKFKEKIRFTNQDFSATEDHMSVFPLGLAAGLKGYIDYRFHNVDNLIGYYDGLAAKGYAPTADQVNMLAYNFFWEGRTPEAIKVMSWAIGRFPTDHNLYDSMGEFQVKAGDSKKAKELYAKAIKLLEQDTTLDKKTRDEKYSYYKGNYDNIK